MPPFSLFPSLLPTLTYPTSLELFLLPPFWQPPSFDFLLPTYLFYFHSFNLSSLPFSCFVSSLSFLTFLSHPLPNGQNPRLRRAGKNCCGYLTAPPNGHQDLTQHCKTSVDINFLKAAEVACTFGFFLNTTPISVCKRFMEFSSGLQKNLPPFPGPNFGKFLIHTLKPNSKYYKQGLTKNYREHLIFNVPLFPISVFLLLFRIFLCCCFRSCSREFTIKTHNIKHKPVDISSIKTVHITGYLKAQDKGLEKKMYFHVKPKRK